jgi:hypothetical protein
MPTVTLKIDEKVSDKILWLLSHFSQNEVEVIGGLSHRFVENKALEALRGNLQAYADPLKREMEEKAWELHVADETDCLNKSATNKGFF